MSEKKYQVVVIGVSAGGMEALKKLFLDLSLDFLLPIIVTQHLHSTQSGFFIEFFDSLCALTVKEAEENEKIRYGFIYFAPPDYHLLIEDDRSFSLSSDEKVNYSRPSIDVLFESAADVYGSQLIGVILTGASSDGTNGMKRIKECGGMTIAQNPEEAEYPIMPKSAIDAGEIDHILSLNEISKFLDKVI